MISLLENQATVGELLSDKARLRQEVESMVAKIPAIDIHTHVHPPEFKSLYLSGIDDLLTYHYLIAETFRSTNLSYADFWRLTKAERADLVWKTLFVDNSPLSEAARGIITILSAFGLDSRATNLSEARAFFNAQQPEDHINRVLGMSSVSELVMTNDPFNEQEAKGWLSGLEHDSRFHASLRLDTLLNEWPIAHQYLAKQNFKVDIQLNANTFGEMRRFLDEWILRIRPIYMAVSLPSDFAFPADDTRETLLREVVLPTASSHRLSLAIMIGVRRSVNPALRSAGDGIGKADITAIERICAAYPDGKFLVTALSRENQHELCVAARKFKNLMPFGCWWFLNNPSIVSEITTERLELLGPSFIPQHSDARVLEQLIYKWQHSRTVIAASLFEIYERLLESGRAVTSAEIQRDVTRMFSGNFREWIAPASS
ncbi:MAG TPA: hypothetical protein VFH91_07525 [Pyrinomonadaceae bacterium]|nr:hypothetical protein [Pyrinomonadaceae bacterium]